MPKKRVRGRAAKRRVRQRGRVARSRTRSSRQARRALQAQFFKSAEFANQLSWQLEKMGMQLIKPLPAWIRMPALFAGIVMLVVGFLAGMYLVSLNGLVIESGRLHALIGIREYLILLITNGISIAGYMIAHKAIEGVWI